MAIKTGRDYIENLRDDRAVYVNGDRVEDVTQYVPFQGIIREIGAHYDRAHEPQYQSRMTYRSPLDDAPVSNSFRLTRTWQEMENRVDGETLRADATYGLMGRLPDFMNAFVTDLAAVGHVLGHKDKAFAANALRYWEYCRDNDICMTHTLVDPRRDYSKGLDAQGALKVVGENDNGIIVSGARMLSTLAPVSEEIFVGPFIPRQPGEEDYALCFGIPVASPGLKFIAREPYASGRDKFDRPLSERFDEGDALALFDKVVVPWERLFVDRDIVAYNMIGPSFPGFLILQANIRGRAKLRFLLGVASKMIDTLGRGEQQHYLSMMGEMFGADEIADGLIEASAREVLAHVQSETLLDTKDTAALAAHFGETASLYGSPDRGMIAASTLRFFIPESNRKVAEIIRLIGSSSLVMTPTTADFANPDTGPLLEQYIHGAKGSARERVQLMKLAWDTVATQFGGRQDIYEIFFSGDPELMRQLHYRTPRRERYIGIVDRLLRENAQS
jgi:4-hydroxyphenylacetate 3-monooxygenase oxygenase component